MPSSSPANGAVDALMRQQHAALQVASPAQSARSGSRKLAEIRQGGKLIEGGDLERHGGVFIRRRNAGKPCISGHCPACPECVI